MPPYRLFEGKISIDWQERPTLQKVTKRKNRHILRINWKMAARLWTVNEKSSISIICRNFCD